MFNEGPMQHGPANTQAEITRKRRLRFEFVVDEAYTAKRQPVRGTELDAYPAQRCHAIGHQAFTAGLVNRGLSPIRNNYGQAALSSRERSRQPAWTAADHENVGLRWQRPYHHRTRINSEQNPGPMAKSTP
jgi:hypothetical protein